MKDAARTKALLACGAISGPLFAARFLIDGAARADYDPIRHPVSSLALGPSGWKQGVSFVVTGLSMIAYAAGLRRAFRPPAGSTWWPLLVGAWGIGLIGAGIFETDPVGGYPPGTPDTPTTRSRHGLLHDTFSFCGFVALVAACFVFGSWFATRGERIWAGYSVASGLAFVVTLVLASAGFGQARSLVDIAGLLQRVMAAIGFGWLALLAFRMLGEKRRA